MENPWKTHGTSMEHPAKIWMISPGQGPGRSLGVAGLVQSTAEIMGTWNITIFLKANQGTQWLHVRLCHVSHVEFPVISNGDISHVNMC